MTHAETCRPVTIEPVPRMAEVPLVRCVCVHGHSWWVTKDGQPVQPPEIKAPRASVSPPPWSPTCLWCRKSLPLAQGRGRNRRYCSPPATCAGQAKRAREQTWRTVNGSRRMRRETSRTVAS